MKNSQRITICLFLTGFLFTTLAQSLAAVPIPRQQEYEDQIVILSETQREILDDLFQLVQDIDNVESRQQQLEEDIWQAEAAIVELQNEISIRQESFESSRDLLEAVLKSYQRRGPGSSLEIILASESFSDLIKRLHLLRDLTRNTGDLLDDLEEQQAWLTAEQEHLEAFLLGVDEQRQSLQALLESHLALRDDLEDRLISLEDERSLYEDRLMNLERHWLEAKEIFTTFADTFSRLATGGSLPQDAISLSFSLFEVKGTLREDALNQALQQTAGIEGMSLQFQPGVTTVLMPEREFQLMGIFALKDGQTLEFIAESGTFYGMQLTDTSIRDLMQTGTVELDLTAVLEGNTLTAVRTQQGALELVSRFSLF
ncbi:coiled-coil domain-containing protein [Anoxynatronum buryatiense]|uniref:N-terminal domain of peptidoglycan hydrolase CwlO-containing protein n=1 Tax=Anoxynatronum buryatiense TaxID=489973 RepID=A0AA45WTQ8_9CLOT|nr:hypothetical protein [Anoxynatronum buryatiense]SMP43157.1 N-terminal domain of peptidoglycan hydrolase CwlO-containing protein [Anoxynatronum buryatiense]